MSSKNTRRFQGRKKGNDASLTNIKNMMKSTDAAKNKQNEILSISVKDIDAKDQVRTSFDETYIEQLGSSMKSDGQLQPVVIYLKDESLDKYWILVGENRWRAAKQAGIDELKAIVVDKPKSDKDRIVFQLAENDQRKDIPPLDRAKSYQALIEETGSAKDVVDLVKKPASFVSKHLALLKMPEPVKAVYDAFTLYQEELKTNPDADLEKKGSWSPDTLNLLTKLYDEDEEAAKQLCSKACNRQISRDEIKSERSRVKFSKESQSKASNQSDNSSSEENDAAVAPTATEEKAAQPGVNESPDTSENQPSSIDISKEPKQEEQSQTPPEKEVPLQDNSEGRFLECDPRKVVFQVSVDGKEGDLVSKRVDYDADYVWVAFGKEVKRVPCQTVSFKRVLVEDE